jgi:chemotaxis protein MotB
MAAEIAAILRSEGQNQTTVHVGSAGLDIAFQGNNVYFASASAVLTPTFESLLAKIAPVLKQSPNEIRVEGFTNNLPLHSTLYATAWELSAARAVNVLRYLTEVCGLPPHQMEADAFGQWHPAVPNNSSTNLALNRSVHIIVTKQAPPGLNQGGPDLAP